MLFCNFRTLLVKSVILDVKIGEFEGTEGRIEFKRDFKSIIEEEREEFVLSRVRTFNVSCVV